MALFKRRNRDRSILAWFLSGSSSDLPRGYLRLLDCPEIQAAIDTYASVIGSATIYLMEHRDDGDHRLHNRLARKLDITPWSEGTRQAWVSWIVSTMMGEGDGNAFVLPHFAFGGDEPGILLDLEPMPGAVPVALDDGRSYEVLWRGQRFDRRALLHFRLFPDPQFPWRGRGYRMTGAELADAIGGADALKASLTSPDYKPPMIVYADVDSDFFSDEKREELRKKYLEDTDSGKPWILPEGVMKAEQFKPLSLTDLAIKDTTELNRTAVAALYRMPPFLLGVGPFNREEYNAWIKRSVLPVCQGITQVLTLGLLDNEDWYFAMPEKRIYAYTPLELVDMGLAMSDRGFANGDEVRDFAMMDPAGLTEFRPLENYIPWDMVALQSKLQPQNGGKNA